MPITINGSGTITGLNVGGLPDGIVDTDMIANNAVTSAKASGLSGLTEVDQWRQNANSDTSDTYFTSNWERVDHNKFDKLGTGVSESSGIFSFPSTGIWSVMYHTLASCTAVRRYVGMDMELTADNGSNWVMQNLAYYYIGIDSGAGYGNGTVHNIVDVDDTSNVKVRFHANAIATVTFQGNTNYNATYVEFMKLGDT